MVLIYEIAGVAFLTTIVVTILEQNKRVVESILVTIAGAVAAATVLIRGAGPTIDHIIKIIGV